MQSSRSNPDIALRRHVDPLRSKDRNLRHHPLGSRSGGGPISNKKNKPIMRAQLACSYFKRSVEKLAD